MPALDPAPRTRTDWLIFAGLLLGTAIFYRASYQVPLSAAGLLLVGVLALWRPGLALLLVPLTVPLFLMPKGIWDARFGIRDAGIRLPLHEVLLLTTAAAMGARWLLAQVQHVGARARGQAAGAPGEVLWRWLPVALFFAAGTLGIVVAPAATRGDALREWRWLIVEPLLFVALMALALRTARAPDESMRALLAAMVAGGALVGLLGALQFAGLNLVPLLGDKVGHSDDRIVVEGVQRVSSVYGHPNNLGLYMGRVWPLAAGLALSARGGRARWLLGCAALLALAGLLVSFSRGAWLGAAGAVLVLALVERQRTLALLRHPAVLAAGAVVLVALVAGALAGVERLNPLGATSGVRLKTWASALAMLRDHPLLGVGLDQFRPLYPHYMHPSLAGTNEQYTAHPHNLLLDVWLRMGVAGVIAFGWLLVRFGRGVWARWRAARGDWLLAGVAAAMVAALLHGLVDSFYFWPDLALWFWVLGVALQNTVTVPADFAIE